MILRSITAWILSILSLHAENYDVIVYGGTPAGVIASVSASREGAKVLLIEPTKHVGGLNSSGLGTSDTQGMAQVTVSGIPMKLYTHIGKAYGKEGPRYTFEPRVFENACLFFLKEATVTILYDRRVLDVEKDKNRIQRLILENGESVSGTTFIDASYEGDLMAKAGVTYTYGRESRDQYQESLAGIRFTEKPVKASPYDDDGSLFPTFTHRDSLKEGDGDKKVQNFNYRLLVTNLENRVPFPKPENYRPERFKMLERMLQQHPNTSLREIFNINSWDYPEGKFELNNHHRSVISIGHVGGNVDYPDSDYETRKRIVEDHKNWTLGLLYFLGHDPSVPQKLKEEIHQYGLSPDEFQDNGNFPYQLYVREARRMLGVYVHTEHDILTHRTKSDSIGLGAHWIDSHPVQRVAISRDEFTIEGRIARTLEEPYEISYRSLTPKEEECGNLLVPVCLSSSRVGFCSIRVEPTWMMLGEAAGMAAAMAAKTGNVVQKINVEKLREQLKSNDVMISKDQEKWPKR